MTTLAQKKAALKEAFPELSMFEIAELLLAQKEERSATISELLVPVRDRFMRKELKRPRAKLQADGTMKLRDTTTYRTYETHWLRLEAAHGNLPIGELTDDHILTFCEAAQTHAMERHAISDAARRAAGKSVKERNGAQSYNHALEAVSAVVRYAMAKGFISETPIYDIARLPLSESDRHGLSPEQVDAIMYVALNGGNDPVLDYLLLWTMLETACRVGGLLKLRVRDIDANRMYVRFHEKGGKSRKQPVSQALAEALLLFASTRNSDDLDDPVFRYHPDAAGKGAPLKAKRFETLWNRIGKELTWVEEKRVTSHWLRHTTLTWVDRVASPTVAGKFAGHGSANVTSQYTKARLEEISSAHQTLFGQSHNTLDWKKKLA